MEKDTQLEKKLNEVLEKNTAVMRTSNGREINDNENLHYEADELIIEELESLGYTKSVEKYKELKQYFWYA